MGERTPDYVARALIQAERYGLSTPELESALHWECKGRGLNPRPHEDCGDLADLLEMTLPEEAT